jgi:hypothetical protein
MRESRPEGTHLAQEAGLAEQRVGGEHAHTLGVGLHFPRPDLGVERQRGDVEIVPQRHSYQNQNKGQAHRSWFLSVLQILVVSILKDIGICGILYFMTVTVTNKQESIAATMDTNQGGAEAPGEKKEVEEEEEGDTEKDEEEPQQEEEERKKPVCWFGSTCFRKSKKHLSKYAHPGSTGKSSTNLLATAAGAVKQILQGSDFAHFICNFDLFIYF